MFCDMSQIEHGLYIFVAFILFAHNGGDLEIHIVGNLNVYLVPLDLLCTDLEIVCLVPLA